MLTVICHFNATEVLGTEINFETRIDMVLETLLEMFLDFIVDYNLYKIDMSMTELMKEFQNAETVPKARSGNTLIVIVEYSHSQTSGGKGGNKRNKPNKKKDGKSKGKKTTADGKSKGKCFSCGLKD
ncbi:uncharacterized protein LOC111379089 [Olea europaea var. sylvestris]|uniref:uncharacterized protein LOC111379089 n=1 Tax=Olea europaea var. sylvestris TaxID=158386 RepID=UPI000C1D62E6|nr:uncharacterized protein LOC111379089 [Olea europaea var. sylvestris]